MSAIQEALTKYHTAKSNLIIGVGLQVAKTGNLDVPLTTAQLETLDDAVREVAEAFVNEVSLPTPRVIEIIRRWLPVKGT